MKSLRIGQVAERAGVATSTIRFYEAEGLLPRAERSGGCRVYDEQIVERLTIIDLAKRAGFSLAEVKQLVDGFEPVISPGERWRSLAREKIVELDARIAEAVRMKQLLEIVRDCECPTFSDCSRSACAG